MSDAPVAASDPVSVSTNVSKGELTRQTILAAAITRFGRDGFRATSVADIARDAAVSGTAAYAHFPNKEALFLAALDEDAAGVIQEGVAHVIEEGATSEYWRETLILTLAAAVEHHPLARRVLSGLEPDVTDRVIEIPAMLELRKSVAERLRLDQESGRVRADIDPVLVADGAVGITVSLLMAVLQLGATGIDVYGPGIWALFSAALDPGD